MLFTVRYPHPPRTTGDQAARAHHGHFSKKKKKLLSTQFFTNLDPCLCWSLQKWPETSVLPHRQQIADTTGRGKVPVHTAAACSTTSSTTSTIPSKRLMLGPNVGQVDRRVDLLDRPDSSVSKSLLQEQVT